MRCNRCFQNGHISEQCNEGIVEYPGCIEELIPLNVRQRWNISTTTPLQPIHPHSESSISYVNTISIPEDYSELKEFIREHKIKVEKVTKESISNCRKAIIDWAKQRGYRVEQQYVVQEITA